MLILPPTRKYYYENFTYIITYENFVVTVKYNRLKYSGTRIFKTIIPYVASTLSSQPIIEWSIVWQVLADRFNEYSNFFLLFVHILNTELHSMYLKKKNLFPRFFTHINNIFLGIQLKHKKFQKEAKRTCFTKIWQGTECIFMLFLTNIFNVRDLYE